MKSFALLAALLVTVPSSVAFAAGEGTVALCFGRTKTECTLRCTGVLVAPNVVLTARHCALTKGQLESSCDDSPKELEFADPGSFWVTTAATMTPKAAYGQGIKWGASAWKSPCGHDVALLELDSSLVGFDEPLMKPQLSGTPAGDASFFAFGPTSSTDATHSDQRKELPASVLCVGTGTKGCSSVAGGDTLRLGEVLTSRTVCQGNSGSPLVSKTSGEIVGTLSRALQLSEGCGLGVTSTISPHALLLSRFVAEIAEKSKYPPPAWVATAQARGNSDTYKRGEVGMPCDDASECASKDCRSRDGGKTFACSQSCATAACPSNLSCEETSEGKFCFEPDPNAVEDSGCSMGSSRSHTYGVAAAALLLFIARLRRRSWSA